MIMMNTVLKILWCWWCLFVSCCAVSILNNRRCGDHFTSIGWTSPRGDITLIEGSDLVINCSIYDIQGPRNSSNIVWRFPNNKVYRGIPLDDRTAQLKISNVTVGNNGPYKCVLESDNTTICLNYVCIGIAPPVIGGHEFDCISNKWKSLKCTWPEIRQCTKTAINWTLSYMGYDSKQAHRSGYFNCSPTLTINKRHMCEIDSDDDPPYPVSAHKLIFKLIGRNTFNTSTSFFKVDHFSIVIPDKVKSFTVRARENRTLKLEWSMKGGEFEYFPVGLFYRLEYRSEYTADFKNVTLGHFKSNQTVSYDFKDTIPNTFYTFRLRCRSENAVDTSRMWSEPVLINITTESSAPDSSVQTVNSSFIEKNAIGDKRDIEIYWKNFLPYQYNGQDFHYLTEVQSQNASVITKKETDKSEFSELFAELWRNQSYSFQIWAENRNGRSPLSGKIFVPIDGDELDCPKEISVVNYLNGIYNVSWKHPSDSFTHQAIQNYTIFWCKKKTSGRCSSAFNWTTVQSNVTTVNITTELVNEEYEIYISADSLSGVNSGLCRSPCQVKASDIVPKRMTRLKVIKRTSSSISVEWDLECGHRLVSIMGFVIRYCRMNSSCQIGDFKKVYINDSLATRHILKNLDYFATYNVSIAAFAAETGDFSEYVTVTTDEDEPGAPQNLTKKLSTNSSVTLCWSHPLKPNGIITGYKITYDINKISIPFGKNDSLCTTIHSLESYHGYLFAVVACNVKMCSTNGANISVTTNVGVPEKPRSLKVHWKNDTHVLVTWASPQRTNGPLHSWTLSVKTTNEGEKGEDQELRADVNNSTIKLQCFGSDWNSSHVVRVRANVQTRDGGNVVLHGVWDNVVVPPCYVKDSIISQRNIYFILLGLGVLLLIVILVVTIYVTKCTKYKGCKMCNVAKVILPEGLGKDELENYHNKLKSQGNYISEQKCEDIIKTCRQSGSSLLFDKSIPEVFPSRYHRKHNDSSDSYSSTRTGKTSISSSHTTYSHMSDSGNEADLPTPDTPDQVFSFKDWVDSLPKESCSEVTSQMEETNDQAEDEAYTKLGSEESLPQFSTVPQYCKAYKIIPENLCAESLITNPRTCNKSDDDDKLENVEPPSVYSCVGLSSSVGRTTEPWMPATKSKPAVEQPGGCLSTVNPKSGVPPAYVLYNPTDDFSNIGKQVGYGYSRVGHFKDMKAELSLADRSILGSIFPYSNVETVSCSATGRQGQDSNTVQCCGEGYVLTVAVAEDKEDVDLRSKESMGLKDTLNSRESHGDAADGSSVDENHQSMNVSTIHHDDTSSDKGNSYLYLGNLVPVKSYVPLVSRTLSPIVVQDEPESSSKPYLQVTC